jgi:LacI family transcriptional regulator
MAATVDDVAQKADVSVATVSRVFNDSDRVRESTRQRVLDAARALDYVPNETARNLIKQQTKTVGVLLPDMHGEFFAQVIRGLDETAREHDYHLLVSSSHGHEDDIRTVMTTLRGRVDGLVVMWPHADVPFLDDVSDDRSDDRPDDRLPVLLLNASESGIEAPSLSVDNRGGAFEAVAHLAEHGHERIATFTGPLANVEARQRLSGYRAAVRELGAVADDALELVGDFRRATGEALVDDLLALSPRPTALFAANDAMAIGALRALDRAGASVPSDLAVVGFDDIPTARYVTPPLSTIRVPMRELGRRAMQRMLDVLAGRTEADPAFSDTLDTELVPRASCGC